jgi:hypothetical protein
MQQRPRASDTTHEPEDFARLSAIPCERDHAAVVGGEARHGGPASRRHPYFPSSSFFSARVAWS